MVKRKELPDRAGCCASGVGFSGLVTVRSSVSCPRNRTELQLRNSNRLATPGSKPSFRIGKGAGRRVVATLCLQRGRVMKQAVLPFRSPRNPFHLHLRPFADVRTCIGSAEKHDCRDSHADRVGSKHVATPLHSRSSSVRKFYIPPFRNLRLAVVVLQNRSIRYWHSFCLSETGTAVTQSVKG